MNTTTPQLIDEVRELLKCGVTDVFGTMLEKTVEPVEPREIHTGDDVFVAASVGFVGDVNGIVYLHLKASLARALAARLLGISEAEADDDELIGDAMGELSNMVVGAAKSRLCDIGLACSLTIPSIVRGRGLTTTSVGSAQSTQITFACDDQFILVELIMKPPVA